MKVKQMLLLIVTLVFVMFTLVHAAPFLVCDEYPTTVTQPTEFEVYMDGSPTPVISPAQVMTPGNGVRIHYDLIGTSTGNHSVTLKAVKVSTEWGRLTSVSSAPFAFTKPVTPTASVGIRLEP